MWSEVLDPEPPDAVVPVRPLVDIVVELLCFRIFLESGCNIKKLT